MKVCFPAATRLRALVLCGRDGLTQAQAGERMAVSRGAILRLLSAARSEVADALGGEKALCVRPDARAGGE